MSNDSAKEAAKAGPDKQHQLRAGSMGLAGVLFLSFAAMSPLTGALGNVPYAVGFGNGSGAPAGFIIGGALFVLFSVGYVAMTRRMSSSGGLYTYVSHGLGRPMGMASGWAAVASYVLIEAAVVCLFAYFARNTIASTFNVDISWPWYALLCLIAVAVSAHFDMAFNARLLAVALVLEVVILAIMDVAVLAQGGADGIDFSPLNPANALTGPAPLIGVFFAIYCWTGFEIIPNFAEESKNPKRTGARALYIVVIVEGLFFLVTSWAVILGWGISKAPDAAAKDPANFFFDVTGQFAGNGTKVVMEWLILTSTFACALAFHNTAARYLYAIGREGLLHQKLGHTHHAHKSPHIASMVTAVVAGVLIVGMVGLWAVAAPINEFADFASMPYVEIYGWFGVAATFLILCNLAVTSLATVFYFSTGDGRGEGHIWKTMLAPGLSFLVLGGLLIAFWANITTFGGDVLLVRLIPPLCILWFVLGVLFAAVLRRTRPDAYQSLGRLVNVGMEHMDEEPVA